LQLAFILAGGGIYRNVNLTLFFLLAFALAGEGSDEPPANGLKVEVRAGISRPIVCTLPHRTSRG